MTYLLAKFTLLFLVASALGFMLGYWWSRRRLVDVTESYETLARANERSDRADWQSLWTRLDALPQPKEPDLKGINVELGALKTAVASIPVPEKSPAVDLSSIEAQLTKLQAAVRDVPKVETHAAANLAPVERKLTAIEDRLSSLPRPQPVNFTEVNSRLDRIEGKLKARPVPELVAKPAKSDEPVILSAALYGDADNLRRISGVGPKLEKLLNKNGVYYFWQVASWNSSDIDFIDERLDAFKGRIARDKWVKQANSLKREPGAASMPG